MLSIFRTNQLTAGILLLFYAVVLHVLGFWYPPVLPEITGGIANRWLAQWLIEHPTWHLPSVIMLLFVQGILANSLVFRHRLTAEVNLFPGVFVVLLGSLLPTFTGYSAFLVGNIFLLLATWYLLNTFRAGSAADVIFNVGFMLGLAALFDPTYLLILVPAGVSLTLLKSGKYRDQTILLLGALLPLYLVGIGYYWYDALPNYWDVQWKTAFGLPIILDVTRLPWAELVLMIVLLLVVILSQGYYLQKTKMETQTKISVLYWVLLGTSVCAFFNMPWQMATWQMAMPLTGILLSFGFTRMKSTTAEALHLLLFLLVFALQLLSQFKFI